MRLISKSTISIAVYKQTPTRLDIAMCGFASNPGCKRCPWNLGDYCVTLEVNIVAKIITGNRDEID